MISSTIPPKGVSPHLQNLLAFAAGEALTSPHLRALAQFGFVTWNDQGIPEITTYGHSEIEYLTGRH